MLKPLNERVLLIPDEAETQTAGGILLAAKKERPSTGTIVVGSDIVKKGDKVLFSKFGYDEADIDGTLHYIVPSTSLLGVFE